MSTKVVAWSGVAGERAVRPLVFLRAFSRAGSLTHVMSAYYVLSYLAFCLPSLLAGNLTHTFGLVSTTDGYGVLMIVLSVGTLVASLRQRPQVCSTGG